MSNNILGKAIFIEGLIETFKQINENTDWNINEPLLWGYFFTNDEPTQLENAKEILVGNGYSFVDLYISEKEEPNEPDLYWLHVEKIEVHTPESLDKLNDKFYILANELGLLSYDGYDVGATEN